MAERVDGGPRRAARFADMSSDFDDLLNRLNGLLPPTAKRKQA